MQEINSTGITSHFPVSTTDAVMASVVKQVALHSHKRAIIARMITMIDQHCQRLLNDILHHPLFQKLEATWRSIKLLADHQHNIKPIKIRILDVTWQEISRDLTKVMDVNQSELFNKIHNQEFGMPGGEPYGVLIGDYEINITHSKDIETLGLIANIAAATFCPFIAGLHPASLELNCLTELDNVQNIAALFNSSKYTAWQALRKSEDARFVGLTLPKTLIRSPNINNKRFSLNFPFQEEDYSYEHYVWSNASFAFASILIKAFAESNWFVHLRGITQHYSGGLVDYLPALHFSTDKTYKYNTEVFITDNNEKLLSDLGFITLCQLKDSPLAVFYDNRSIQAPKIYQDDAANANAKISATLQYIFCASRFAHYIKIIGRDKIGSFLSHLDCEHYLNHWLIQYIAGNDDLTADQKLNYPLRDARVQIKQSTGKPGHYACIIYLQPRLQLDQIHSTLVLVTELAPIST